MRHLTTASLVAIALSLGACGGTADDRADNAMMADNMAVENDLMAVDNGMAIDNAMAMPASAQEMVNLAAASDMYEIESSQLAGEKAQRAEVREFAQMLVTDHQKSTADLKTAAGAADPPLTVTPAMNAEQQANMEALRGAADADFDRIYLAQQVPAHETALSMLQSYAAGGDVDGLKTWAANTATVVSGHLDRARELSR